MAFNTLEKSIVTLAPRGNLAVQIKIDGKVYTTLISDIVPKTQADINEFIFNVTQQTTITNYPEDYKPLALREGYKEGYKKEDGL